jgi:hypothetical protein
MLCFSSQISHCVLTYYLTMTKRLYVRWYIQLNLYPTGFKINIPCL